jgi:hypothetical protein
LLVTLAFSLFLEFSFLSFFILELNSLNFFSVMSTEQHHDDHDDHVVVVHVQGGPGPQDQEAMEKKKNPRGFAWLEAPQELSGNFANTDALSWLLFKAIILR